MREVVRQLSTALRSLSRQPAVMVPAVVTLALGIGANTALFAYLAYMVWPTLDAPEPARVVWVYSGLDEEPRALASYPEFLEIQRGQDAVTDMVVYSRFGMSIAHGQQTSFGWGHLVSGGYFSFFGARPAVGRLLQPGDDRADAPPVAVLGHGFWRGTLGADPGVVGREMRINGIGVTVVGVAAEGFQGEGLASAVYVPALQSDRMTAMSRIENRDAHWLYVLGRIAPGMSETRAHAALQVLGRSLDAAYPLPEGEKRRMDLAPATRHDAEYDDGNFVDAAQILMAVATAFLLLGCASIANLLLARAISKQREWGIRASLGASRSWLIGGVLAESAVLCLVGGLAGLAVASVLEQRIETYVGTAPGGLGSWSDGTEMLRLDARTVGFAVLVTAFCAVLGALGPVLRVLRGDLLGPLKSDASGGAGGRSGGLAPRKVLVVLQVALSVLLLLGGGLLVRTLESARRVDPGFDPDGLLLATINIPRNVMNQEGGGEIFQRVLAEARSTPGVMSASLVHVAPLSGWSRGARVTGGNRPDEPLEISYNAVAPDYFATVGISILAGRPLDGRDRKDSAPAVVVSRELARQLWGEAPSRAVGQLVRMDDPQSSENMDRPFEVVGVAEDIRHSVVEAGGPLVYLSYEQRPHPRMTLVVRSAAPLGALAPQLGKSLRQAHPDLSVVDLLSCREQIRRSLVQQQMYAEIAGLFALLGLAVAVIGLFGLLSYSVSLRRREFGIRMAIGAKPRDVRRLVVRQGMSLVGLGVAAGVLSSLALSRVLAGLLFGVGATDPLTFVSIPVVLALISLLACWLPAVKAARIPPTVAIKGA